MGQVTPNGTYKGGSDSDGTSAVLSITNSNPDTGVINAATYTYSGRLYNVRGTFFYSDISNHTSSVTFNLTATSTDGSPSYNIYLESADRDYYLLQGHTGVVGSPPQFSVSLGRQ